MIDGSGEGAGDGKTDGNADGVCVGTVLGAALGAIVGRSPQRQLLMAPAPQTETVAEHPLSSVPAGHELELVKVQPSQDMQAISSPSHPALFPLK